MEVLVVLDVLLTAREILEQVQVVVVVVDFVEPEALMLAVEEEEMVR
jgi:hypothetical protein